MLKGKHNNLETQKIPLLHLHYLLRSTFIFQGYDACLSIKSNFSIRDCKGRCENTIYFGMRNCYFLIIFSLYKGSVLNSCQVYSQVKGFKSFSWRNEGRWEKGDKNLFQVLCPGNSSKSCYLTLFSLAMKVTCYYCDVYSGHGFRST